MSSGTVRDALNDINAVGGPGRYVHQLSDGVTTAAVVIDGTSIFVLTSTDRVTWTQRANISAAFGAYSTFSSAIGANNNLHIVYRGSDQHIYYRKLTYAAGPTYTVGAAETVQLNTGSNVSTIDIDILTGDVPVIVGSDFTSPSRIRFYVRRTSDNTWQNFRNINVSTTGWSNHQGVSVARDSGGVDTGASTAKFAFVALTPDKTVYSGDLIGVGLTVNYNTGANVSNGALISNLFNATGKDVPRTYQLFSVASARYDLVCAVGKSTLDARVGRLNNSGWQVNLVTKPFDVGAIYDRSSTVYNEVAMAHNGDSGVIVYQDLRNNVRHTYNVAFRVSDSGVTWISPNSRSGAGDFWDYYTSGTDYDANVNLIFGGNNRNFSATKRLSILYQQATTWLWRYKDNDRVKAPVNQSPANGGTVATNTPTLQTKVTNAGWQQSRSKAIFQLAKDSAFTTSLKTITMSDSEYAYLNTATGGSTTLSKIVNTGSAISQGTWYMRSALIDAWGIQSAWSPTTSFTNSHPPSASVQSPTGDVKFRYAAEGVSFTWVYSSSSPGSQQTAYQIRLETNPVDPLTAPATVVDTGKVVSTSTSATIVIPDTYKSQPLRWSVRVWDEDDVVGTYSQYGTFLVADSATVEVFNPVNGSTINSPTPTLQWTFTPPATDSTVTQKKFRVTVHELDVLVYDSGWKVDQVTSFDLPNGYLENNLTYTVTVEISDSNDLQNSDSISLATSWTPPAAPAFTVDASGYGPTGAVLVSWNNDVRDESFVSWRAYRRRLDGSYAWKLIYETTVDQNDYAFNDYLTPSSVPVEYAIVQTANRFGSLVESAYNASTSVTPISEDYWLVDPESTGSAVRLNIVTSDSYSENYESEEILLIGRGRKMDYGTRWGYSGTLTVKLYDDQVTGITARQKRQNLQALRSSLREFYLRNPFGDVWLVALEDLQISRIAGVGHREFVEVQIPYKEVAPANIVATYEVVVPQPDVRTDSDILFALSFGS